MHMRESCLTQILHENLRVYVTKEAPSPSLRRKRKNTKTHIETNKHKGIYEFFPADSTRIHSSFALKGAPLKSKSASNV